MTDRKTSDNDAPEVSEGRLRRIEADDVDIEEELAVDELLAAQREEGHTYDPQQAAEEGLTYTPPSDPPIVPSEDDLQGAKGVVEVRNHLSVAGEDQRGAEAKEEQEAKQAGQEGPHNEADQEDIVDETLKESFPASDPPSWTSSGI